MVRCVLVGADLREGVIARYNAASQVLSIKNRQSSADFALVQAHGPDLTEVKAGGLSIPAR